jgi:hypothetical protein
VGGKKCSSTLHEDIILCLDCFIVCLAQTVKVFKNIFSLKNNFFPMKAKIQAFKILFCIYQNLLKAIRFTSSKQHLQLYHISFGIFIHKVTLNKIQHFKS